MRSEVEGGCNRVFRDIFSSPKSHVAGMAEQTSVIAGSVVVIHGQTHQSAETELRLWSVTNRTDTTLGCEHLVVIPSSDAI